MNCRISTEGNQANKDGSSPFVLFVGFCSKRPSTIRSARRRTSWMSYRRRQSPDAGLDHLLSKTERLAALSSIRFVRRRAFISFRQLCMIIGRREAPAPQSKVCLRVGASRRRSVRRFRSNEASKRRASRQEQLCCSEGQSGWAPARSGCEQPVTMPRVL